MSAAASHPGDDELALYVLDALGAEGRRRLEQHVGLCTRCARRLAAEAAAELELAALWPEVSRLRQPLAPVVPLRPPEAPLRATASRTERRASSRGPAAASASAGGGVVAAAVVLLFIGWSADAHRGAVPVSAMADGCDAARVCRADSPDDGAGPLCSGETRPAAAELASWAACVSPRR